MVVVVPPSKESESTRLGSHVNSPLPLRRESLSALLRFEYIAAVEVPVGTTLALPLTFFFLSFTLQWR